MNKKNKIDFVIRDNDLETLIFRFLPRQSSCHSFGDEPPVNWEDVYKVYYAYKIIKKWKDDGCETELFHSGCDECSIIDEVSARIGHIVDCKKSITVNRRGEDFVIKLLNNEILPMGDGVSWTINKTRERDLYEIVLWRWDSVGYRFYLKKDKLKEFGKYLDECCEYMLAHGDPI